MSALTVVVSFEHKKEYTKKVIKEILTNIYFKKKKKILKALEAAKSTIIHY